MDEYIEMRDSLFQKYKVNSWDEYRIKRSKEMTEQEFKTAVEAGLKAADEATTLEDVIEENPPLCQPTYGP